MKTKTKERISAEKLHNLRNDRVEFCKLMFNVDLDEWQTQTATSLDSGLNTTIKSGHGVGKTALLAFCANHFLVCNPYSRVVCTAPTHHTLSDKLWAEMYHWIHQSPILSKMLEWTASKIAPIGYRNEWFAIPISANTKPENFAGFHADNVMIIVDEASGVDDIIMQTAQGAMTTENCLMVMASNPTKDYGFFFDSFHRNRSKWNPVTISSEDSARVKKEWVQEMIETWGADSDIVRVRVKGDFPRGQSGGFIPLSIIEQSVLLHEDNLDEEGKVVIGIDVARMGDDRTCFVIRKGRLVAHIETYQGWRTTETAGRAMQLIRDYQAEEVNIDDTGVGGGVTDILINEGLACSINGCNFGGSGDEYYYNASSLWAGRIKTALEKKELFLPNNNHLIAEMTARKYDVTTGRIRLEQKDRMRARGLPSPDIFDALMLTYAFPETDNNIYVGETRKIYTFKEI